MYVRFSSNADYNSVLTISGSTISCGILKDGFGENVLSGWVDEEGTARFTYILRTSNNLSRGHCRGCREVDRRA